MTRRARLVSRRRQAPLRHHSRCAGLLAVCPDDTQHRAGDGGRPRDRDQRHEHRRVDHGVVLGHLHRRGWRSRRSGRTGEDLDVGIHPQHRRLAAGRDRAAWRAGGTAADAGPHLPGTLGRVHHAGEPRAHQDVLGRRRPSAGGESLVHGLLGRFWIRRSLRRPHDRERGMALDLLRVGRGISGRDADGARDTGEQGCRRKGLSV